MSRVCNICGVSTDDMISHLVQHHGPNAPSSPVVITKKPTPTNPKDLVGITKVQLNLVPASSLIYQALAMEDGAKKYGPFNWRDQKIQGSIYIAAVLRHLFAWMDGEDNASDSQKPHLAHALAGLGILIDALETGNLIDDRPKAGAAAKLIAATAKKKEGSDGPKTQT